MTAQALSSKRASSDMCQVTTCRDMCHISLGMLWHLHESLRHDMRATCYEGWCRHKAMSQRHSAPEWISWIQSYIYSLDPIWCNMFWIRSNTHHAWSKHFKGRFMEMFVSWKKIWQTVENELRSARWDTNLLEVQCHYSSVESVKHWITCTANFMKVHCSEFMLRHDRI